MSEPPKSAPMGWYHAEGDPPGTMRHWDGSQWVGEPRSAASAGPVSGVADHDFLPELGYTLASPGSRIAARVIDSLIAGFAIGAVLVVVFVMFVAASRSGDGPLVGAPEALIIGLLLVAPLGAFYEVGFVALRGATPGKMLMGIEVITQNGLRPPGWGPSVLRWLINLVGFVPIVGFSSGILTIISFVMLFTDSRRRTINDHIGKTYVIQKP